MGKININQLERYENEHRPFKKTRRSKKKNHLNVTPTDDQVKQK